MDRYGLRGLAGLLLYGDAVSVDRVAHDLVARGDPQLWQLLVGTIHSEEDLPIRLRCLEVLLKSASLGGDETARQVLAALGAAVLDRSPGDEEGERLTSR